MEFSTPEPANAARVTRLNRVVLIWAILSTSCLVLTYGCVCLFGSLIYAFGRSPDHLLVQSNYPLTVHEAERFDMTVTLRNWGSTTITVTEVSLGNDVGGALLDGLIVRKVDELLTRKPDARGYTCNIPLEPGEQRQLVFTFEGRHPGEFGDSLQFVTSEGSLWYDVAVGVARP